MKTIDLKVQHKALLDYISFFDTVKNLDLIHISIDEIDFLLNEIDAVEDDIDFKDNLGAFNKEVLFEISDLFGKIEVKDGEITKAEFDKMIHDPQQQAMFIKLVKYLQRFTASFARVQFSFIIMAFFTTKHNNFARYIDGDTNPMKIYTKRLPLVRRQEELMHYFEDALNELYRLIQLKPFQL